MLGSQRIQYLQSSFLQQHPKNLVEFNRKEKTTREISFKQL